MLTFGGSIAKSIFDRAKLPNDVLIRIWNLADIEQRGKLSETEFIIAMHLLASFRSGAMRALPNNLPAGLYEAAARRGTPSRQTSSSRAVSEGSPASAIPRQFSETGVPRTSSPLARQPYNAPNLSAQTTGASAGDWAVPTHEKAQYDTQFSRLDSSKQGFVTGEQAVGFFSNSRLSENDLAQIWDLADITQTGQLSQDEFAVAMHLIRQQLNSRGPLPATLPSNLIPPSMRRQAVVPQASQAASVATPSKPKSAAEDLFGLDSLTTPAHQVPQSTGGSSSIAAASAPHSASSPSPQQQSTHFKPFVPSSSFGQSIATPQATGSGGGGQSAQQSRAPADDDLLGDTDPEINKRFTDETMELANLSNQVSTLTNQMKDVQNKQVSNKQELSEVTNQKRDFETRLSQLRSAYEQEARELKSIQDKLATVKSETTKLQQDLAMAQHSYQSLQEQRQQTSVGLEADQKENASLKGKIAQVYKETNQIKPQIEKMRSEARQQKGLVAINKKQLSTAEGEREKARADLNAATAEHNEATKELEDSKRSLEASRTISTGALASPAPSTSSMNPFFRRTTSTTSDRPAMNSPFAAQPASSPNHSAFDSFFGSALEESRPFTPSAEPQVHEAPQASQQPSGSKSAEAPSNTSKKAESPRFPSASQPPPPPPHSRQMTPSSLPLREGIPRAPSSTSSIGVIPPASQFGDLSAATTPTKDEDDQANRSVPQDDLVPKQSQPEADSLSSREVPANLAAAPHEPPSAPPNIPGAFPSDITPAETPIAPVQEGTSGSPFGNGVKSSPLDNEQSAKSAFDSAFGTYEGKGKAPINSSAFGGGKETSRSEFPPIQEFGDDDDDSDSEAEQKQGFDDSFVLAKSSGERHGADSSRPLRPSLSRDASSVSQLPTPNAQKSPPSYGEAVSPPIGDGSLRDANQFAAEYTGLLPPREDPTTSPHLHSVEHASDAPNDNDTIPTTSVTAVDNPPDLGLPQPPVPPKTTVDDFESAFGDLSEAQTADERVDDDFGSSAREGFDDFNPTFDSPAPSQPHSKAPTLDNSGFQDFESNFSAPSQSISASAAAGAPTRPGPTKDEWDAMFAGFGEGDASASQANGDGTATGGPGRTQKSDGFLDVFSVPESGVTAASRQQGQDPQKPQLSRAISTGTEHDDPIVKRLTGMGYSRELSVAALEKFDYNLDKV